MFKAHKPINSSVATTKHLILQGGGGGAGAKTLYLWVWTINIKTKSQ